VPDGRSDVGRSAPFRAWLRCTPYSVIERSLGNNDLRESCEVSRLTVGCGKRGVSGPGSVSSGETASASSCFGGMICHGPGVEHLLCCPKPARRRLDQVIHGKSAAHRRDGQCGWQPWCYGRHLRCNAETHRAHPRCFGERHHLASVVVRRDQHPGHPHLWISCHIHITWLVGSSERR
jgi:hypothetical protein